MKNIFLKGIIFGIGFISTILAFIVGYAAWTNITTKSDGQSINAVAWNELVNNINVIGNKVDVFTNNSGNIGIGIATPSDKIHTNGNIKMQGIGNSLIWTKGSNGNDTRIIERISPDADKLDDFEIITMNRSTGLENHRTRYAYDGTWYFPGNVTMGYEIVNDSRVPGAGATSYSVLCPNGKYLLSSSVRTVGGRMAVAHENSAAGVSVFSDRAQFNSQLGSGIITTLICANIR